MLALLVPGVGMGGGAHVVLVYGPFCVDVQMLREPGQRAGRLFEPGQAAGRISEPGQVRGAADCER
jgi:hypothetical protein